DRAGWMVGRYGPEQRPEIIGRGIAVRLEGGRQPLAVAQFHCQALDHLVVGHLAARLQRANAERHGFLALVLVVQDTEWAGLFRQRMTNNIALEEQLSGRLGLLALILGLRASSEAESSDGQCNSGDGDGFHLWAPFPTSSKMLLGCVR